MAVLAVACLLGAQFSSVLLTHKSLSSASAATTNTGTSSDGRLTVTKSPSADTVPFGGGAITYTYTVTNNFTERLYFISIIDDKCPTVSPTQPLPNDGWNDYLAPNQSATFTCTQTVTQTTTNNVTVKFHNYWNTQTSTATTSATVTLSGVASNSCDTLWYGSDANPYSKATGTVGTLSTSAVLNPRLAINWQDPTGGTGMNGSAAVAVNPANPNQVYFIPRHLYNTSDTMGGLWVYDASTGSKTEVTTPSNTPDVVRLSVAPDGTVWTIDTNGTLWSWTTGSTTWTNRGTITLPAGGPTTSWGSLQSGDLAFDGLGTMWFIASTSNNAYLFTITSSELAGTDGANASYVGPMGSGSLFNGIAFTSDGTLWATSSNFNTDGSTSSTLYTVNPVNGKATAVGGVTGLQAGEAVGDLGSCALPKPALRATKSVSPTPSVTNGSTLTYTITIQNIGTLAATGVKFQDILPAGETYVAGSAQLNGAQVNTSSTNPYSTVQLVKDGGSGTLNGVIGAGQAATITLQAKVTATSGSLCNQGSLTLTGGTATLKTDDANTAAGGDATCVKVQSPGINVKKTANATTLASPGPVTYTYTVTNTGTEPLKNVTLADDKCPNPQLQAANTSAGTGDLNGDGNLDLTETWIYTCTQTLTGTTTNTATATGTGTTSGKTVTSTDTWTVTVTTPNLTVTKTSDATSKTLNPGDTVTYTITVKNTGTAVQNNVTLTDPLPTGLTYVAGSSNATWTKNTAAYTGTASASPQSGTLPLSIDGTTADALGTTVNQSITVPASAFPAGAQVTGYTLTVAGQANSTNGANCGMTRDVALQGSFSGGATASKIPQVDAYATSSASGTGWAQNSAGTGFATTPTDNTSSCSGPWQQPKAWGALPSGATSPTVSGSLTDNGTVSTNGVTLALSWTDIWNNGTTKPDNQLNSLTLAISYSVPAASVQANVSHDVPNLVTSADGVTLQPGQVLTATFKATVGANAPASITNVATAASSTSSPVNASTVVNVASPAFEVSKTVDGTNATGAAVTVDANGNASVTYQVKVANTGAASGTTPAVTDTMSPPAGFAVTGVTYTQDGGTAKTTPTVTNNAFSIPGGTSLAAGASTIYYVTVNLKAADLTQVDWTAAGSCDTSGTGNPAKGAFNSVSMPGDGITTNNDACVPLKGTPTFSVTKTADGVNSTGAIVAVNPDGTATVAYEIDVTNTSTISGMPPAVTDTMALPAGFTAKSATLNGVPVSLTPSTTAFTGCGTTIACSTFTIPAATSNLDPGWTTSYTLTVSLQADMSKVNWLTASTCSTTGNGDPTKGAFNSVAMTGDSNGSADNDACIPLTTSIGLHKLGNNGAALAGATFALYGSDPSAAGATPIAGGITVNPTDGSLFTTVPLAPGVTYWLVETKAPAGYNLLAQPIQFSLGANGATVSSSGAKVDSSNNLLVDVSDVQQLNTLPSTGGAGAPTGAALAALVVGLALVAVRRRRNDETLVD